MDTYYFNLPQITDLNPEQQAALNEIKAIGLSGGPGTGKSLVSLWRHISRSKQGKNCLLLTFTTTLARYLRISASKENAKAGENVSSTIKWLTHPEHYDEIIIDEAQDIEIDKHDEINGYADMISYGADKDQGLFAGCTLGQLEKQYPNNKSYFLDKNYRSTQRIIQFAKRCFEEVVVANDFANSKGELPVFLISNGSNYEISNDEQNYAILDIIRKLTSKTHNIAVLLPWKKHVKYFNELVKAEFPTCSRYYEDTHDFPKGCTEISNIHITTFKSAKGLEFDTVVIPNFHKIKEVENMPEEYNIKWNDYYVGITRAKNNLYLISNTDIPRLGSVVDKSVVDMSNTTTSATFDEDNLPF